MTTRPPCLRNKISNAPRSFFQAAKTNALFWLLRAAVRGDPCQSIDPRRPHCSSLGSLEAPLSAAPAGSWQRWTAAVSYGFTSVVSGVALCSSRHGCKMLQEVLLSSVDFIKVFCLEQRMLVGLFGCSWMHECLCLFIQPIAFLVVAGAAAQLRPKAFLKNFGRRRAKEKLLQHLLIEFLS